MARPNQLHALTLCGGTFHAGHPAVWQPRQIIVTEGDEVSLEFVGINGAEHPTTIVGYDKALVLKRGHVVRVEHHGRQVRNVPHRLRAPSSLDGG